MSRYHDIATRAQVVALRAHGVSVAAIEAATNISNRSQRRMLETAQQRGYQPGGVLLDEHVKDAPRSGAPRKRTQEIDEKVAATVRRDRYGREKGIHTIAGELYDAGIEISPSTIHRSLRAQGFKSVKPTRKPGLTPRMRQERLNWALKHKDWTLDQWKDVIWTDETSVVMGVRRGGVRIWRQSSEKFNNTCIRNRWKGYSEFMFWAAFSYDTKGPFHIYKKETKAQKKKAEAAIKKLNEENEPIMKAEWELNTGVERLGLRGKPGPKPQWKFDKDHGKLSCSGRGGIDWWRYKTEVLEAKLLPFAKECQKSRPNTLVQEDKAPAHQHWYQEKVYNLHEVQRLIWCGNSPDLNAIEPCWPWLKRRTTAKGAPTTHAAMEKHWQLYWESLEQWRIQRWIERIPHHIQEIIRLNGGNEYSEGVGERPQHWFSRVGGDDDPSNTVALQQTDTESDDDSNIDTPPLNRPIFGDFRDEMTWSELEEFESVDDTDGNSSSGWSSGIDAEGSTDDEA